MPNGKTMKRVINIVEDEKDINNLVAQYLMKEDYEVHSYYTYEEASAHAKDEDVHLWILDIMLDDKSGFDLLEEIRQTNPDTPIIFMSARDKEFDRIIGRLHHQAVLSEGTRSSRQQSDPPRLQGFQQPHFHRRLRTR